MLKNLKESFKHLSRIPKKRQGSSKNPRNSQQDPKGISKNPRESSRIPENPRESRRILHPGQSSSASISHLPGMMENDPWRCPGDARWDSPDSWKLEKRRNQKKEEEEEEEEWKRVTLLPIQLHWKEFPHRDSSHRIPFRDSSPWFIGVFFINFQLLFQRPIYKCFVDKAMDPGRSPGNALWNWRFRGSSLPTHCRQLRKSSKSTFFNTW